jgi:mannose-6-phosphate isomerase-like protein (cupin superfamily)
VEVQMADYTIKNLREDVEDAAPKFGMSPDVEARFDRQLCANMAVSFQHLAPDVRLPFGHRHREQEEVYVVLEGSGRVRVGEDERDVRKWDAVRVGSDTMRSFEAGPDGLTLLAVGAPRTDENDAELEQGWWG